MMKEKDREDREDRKGRKGKKVYIGVTVVLLLLMVGGGLLWKKLNCRGLSLLNQKKMDYHIGFSEHELKIGEEETIDVLVGEAKGSFPAVSAAIDFNQNKLEFVRIDPGTYEITNQITGEKMIPDWPFQKELANAEGTVRTMYLDLSAGNAAVTLDHLEEGKNILFRLVFRVKSSCIPSESLQLTFSNATFAATDEKESLSLQQNTITVKNASFEVVH